MASPPEQQPFLTQPEADGNELAQAQVGFHIFRPVHNNAFATTSTQPKSLTLAASKKKVIHASTEAAYTAAYTRACKKIATLSAAVIKHAREVGSQRKAYEKMWGHSNQLRQRIGQLETHLDETKDRIHILEMRLDATSNFQLGEHNDYLHAVDRVIGRVYPHLQPGLVAAERVFQERMDKTPTVHGWYSLTHSLPGDLNLHYDPQYGNIDIFQEELTEMKEIEMKRSTEAYYGTGSNLA